MRSELSGLTLIDAVIDHTSHYRALRDSIDSMEEEVTSPAPSEISWRRFMNFGSFRFFNPAGRGSGPLAEVLGVAER